MDEKMQKEIVKFSCGYPHFTHLLSLHACRCAVLRSRLNVDFYPDFDLSVSLAIQESFESLRNWYHDAKTTNIESLYEEVLWAAALAETDENYSFQAKDLVVPLGKILGKAVKYQSFIGHLSKFCSLERGQILEKYGRKRRVRY